MFDGCGDLGYLTGLHHWRLHAGDVTMRNACACSHPVKTPHGLGLHLPVPYAFELVRLPSGLCVLYQLWTSTSRVLVLKEST